MFSPIAIVGEACLLPGAHSPDELWRIVSEGRVTISEAPASRWRADRERMLSTGICASAAGGFVEEFAQVWNPSHFHDLDPLVHWLLHVGANALTDAGIVPGDRLAAKTGAIVGNLAYPTEGLVDLAQSVYPAGLPERPANPRNRFSAGLPVHILCNALGLQAGGYAIDAACASSLYALKIACDWLNTGRADAMLAGAINRVEGLLIHAGFTALRALSPSGRSRPFHRDADGLVPAEGAALLVLKRLADAEEAGDRILGVIRGIGLSNDGRGTGLLTPLAEGQVRAMEAAYVQSGLQPRDISLIECHATGTSVGDAVELRSMSEVFSGLHDIPIASLKSNLGHLITASGAAGVIKVLQALQHEVRPPTLNASPAGSAIEGTPFRLIEEREAWSSSAGVPRRAAINSFGFGGNNAHLLLEEYLPRTLRVTAPIASPRRAAIVSIAARMGDGRTTHDFLTDFFTATTRIRQLPDGTPGARAVEVRLPATGLVFPPRDLERALAQQNLLLEVAGEALNATPLNVKRTSAFIGMSCDAETTRTVLRACLADNDAAQFSDSLDAGFDAARVTGCMPNILANRLNRQFGLEGPSFTVAAEELSGLRALDIGLDALASGSIDAAIIGAVDLCVEPVHCAALSELPADKQIPGDGACVMILKTVEEATRNLDPIHAIIEISADSRATLDGSGIARRVRHCFGHVHAASGLIDVAAAAIVLSGSAVPDPSGTETIPLLPGSAPHRILVEVNGMSGQSFTATVIEADHPMESQRAVPPVVPDILIFASNNLTGLMRAIESGEPSTYALAEDQQCRLAIVATAQERPERLRLARSFLERFERGGPVIPPEGVFFHPTKIDGGLAFVYTGATAAYPGMGRELLLALPELAQRVSVRCADLNRYAGWIYRSVPGFVPNDFQRLCGSSFLCQIHSEFTGAVLGLHPQAAIGLSSGETNALYALGAWNGMHELLDELEQCELYTAILGGRAEAVRQAWSERHISGQHWTSYWVSAPLQEVENAICNEPAAHVTILNSPRDIVIGGTTDACERAAARIGTHRCIQIETDFAVHCPEVGPAAPLWRRLHHRPTVNPAGIRFYSNAFGHAYDLTADSVADALTKQALEVVDFPRTIRRAWDDGVRIFVEHGPRSQCTQSIRAILGDRQFLAVGLDVFSRSSLRQALSAAAELWTAGINVDLAALKTRLAPEVFDEAPPSNTRIFPAHPPAPRPFAEEDQVFVMTPAPKLSPLLDQFDQPVTARNTAGPRNDAAFFHEQISKAHQEHLRQLALLDQTYQEVQGRLLKALAAGGKESEAIEIVSKTSLPNRHAGKSFSRRDLEIHASGRISDVFGPAFSQQDNYPRQVRMPEPPLLLADRVTSLIGEPGSMGSGSITTETDIAADSWYLHQGRMPAGIAIEAGQADLMLISWLGVDNLNQGRRVYRLLGCDLTFSGSLPRVGETLRYDIHVDGHASHGDVRMFFFHYDCHANHELRLRVRNGQAGFFTDKELATSEGVLWSPEDNPPQSQNREVAFPCLTSQRSFDSDQIRAFGEGRVVDCFGPEFKFALTHTRTPRIQSGRMQLVQRAPALDPAGGPWGRGYLRMEWPVRADDWLFKGHFKNDPCMPGTLMFEGCMQAMAFYLTAMGFTLENDGWRFEPVPDEAYSLRCRGQVLPASKNLVYEVFVDEIITGPLPTLYADVLCTVDGLKAFHCHRLGLRLVPDWPLDEPAAEHAHSAFDDEALMACAAGRPSNAFGPAFARFDGPIRVPRLPGPPYHFMSRVTHAEVAASTTGSVAAVEYEVPADAWYFAENGHPVMPVSVLTEVLLQPCGWLASFAGTWRDVQHDIFFRNLDGSGVVHAEVGPHTGILRTRTILTSFSQLGPMSITAFNITCHAGPQLVFEGQAVFGHFPAEALQKQAGLPASEEETNWFSAQAPCMIDLDILRAAPFFGREKLRLLDRITGFWPDGGAAETGLVRAEMDVDPGQWFFKAHFFGDPVQPGSLGLEAVVQTLQAYMIATNRHEGLKSPRFESIATGEPVSWTYRGQVLPHNKRVTILLEVLAAERGFAKASASLWVDGKKIYVIPGVSMRLVEHSDLLDPVADTWLCDHCPTYTVPVLPMMSIVDRLASAAQRTALRRRVVELRDITLNGWISFGPGARRLKTDAVATEADTVEVTLSVWRDAPHAALSRFDVMAHARVRMADEFPAAPALMNPLTDPAIVSNPYESGELFHGPAFRFLQKLSRSKDGSSFVLDANAGAVPRGLLNQGLFDGVTHGIPNENLTLWSERIGSDQVGYPSRIIRLALFADPPSDGISNCEVRFEGFHLNEDRFPRFRAQLIKKSQVWAEIDLVYALFPKGPIGIAPALQRRAFLQEKVYVSGIGLGHFSDNVTSVHPSDLYESDWLPGTIESAFALTGDDRVREVAIKQHVARSAEVHPCTVTVSADSRSARCNRYPLTEFPIDATRDSESWNVRDAGSPRLNCDGVRDFWSGVFGIAEWPIADLHIGLIERFIGRVVLLDPKGFAAIRGKPAIYLANHQVAAESILFNVIVSALSESPIRVIAKAEHRKSWIGQLIAITHRYPGLRAPEPILYFDRADPQSIFDVLDGFRRSAAQSPASLMVHVDGTRARSCRTPVSQVSSVFLELALDLGCPVVPVWFAGGLPARPVENRLEFPFGGGQQDILIGSSILAEELRDLSMIERSRLILNAINGLAPDNERNFGTGENVQTVPQVLMDSLRNAGRRCAATDTLLSALDGNGQISAADDRDIWLDALNVWFKEMKE